MRSVEDQADEVVKSIRSTMSQARAVTNVLFTCNMWPSVANDQYLTVILHWLDEKWDMQTIILGTMEFNGRQTKHNISKAMLKVRSKFGIFPVQSSLSIYQSSRQVIGESLRIWGLTS